MFLKEKSNAIVLSRENYGEADQKVVLLTDCFGKISTIANGEKKMLSKLRAGLSLFSWSEVELVFGRNLPIITMARPRNCFINLSHNWQKFVIAQKMAQDINILIPRDLVENDIWLLSLGAFHALNSINGHYQRLYYYFLWTLLSVSGYKIDLYRCARCGQKLSPKSFLVAGEGIVCDGCFSKEDHFEIISPNTVKILRIIARKDKNILNRIQTSVDDRENLKKISQFFLESNCLN